MKYLILLILTCNITILIAQTNPRITYQNKLAILTEELKVKTNAQFVKGPMFLFEKPYKAVFIKDSEFKIGKYPNWTTTKFNVGDTILITGAKPVGKTLRFRSLTSDEAYETKAFGRPKFEVINSEAFNTQIKKIKDSNWQKAEEISAMLDCGALESSGRSNLEKHHINIGDTPVFFQVRLEQEKVFLYFDLKTYGGSDFKNVGVAIGGKSTLGLNFDDGSEIKIKCESDDDRFAIFDITNYKNQCLSGINKISFSLSKKEVSKELFDEYKYAIGLKMECMGD